MQENYIRKLEDSLNESIADYVKELRSLNIRGYSLQIDKVDRVYSSVNLESIKLHILLSGGENEILVEGQIRLFEKLENGSRSRNIEFWVRSAKVKFDLDKENFDILDLSKFLAIDIVR